MVGGAAKVGAEGTFLLGLTRGQRPRPTCLLSVLILIVGPQMQIHGGEVLLGVKGHLVPGFAGCCDKCVPLGNTGVIRDVVVVEGSSQPHGSDLTLSHHHLFLHYLPPTLS